MKDFAGNEINEAEMTQAIASIDWSRADEHADPEKWCRAPLCKDTNWGGCDRLHLRGAECPAYSPSPEPNPTAELWEAIREGARQNARHRLT